MVRFCSSDVLNLALADNCLQKSKHGLKHIYSSSVRCSSNSIEYALYSADGSLIDLDNLLGNKYEI